MNEEPIIETGEYSLIDIRTSEASITEGEILEISVIKIKNGAIIERYSTVVRPTKPIDKLVFHLTSISKEEVENAYTLDNIIPKVLQIIGDSIIISHNAKVTYDVLKRKCERLGLALNNKYMDLRDTSSKVHKLLYKTQLKFLYNTTRYIEEV